MSVPDFAPNLGFSFVQDSCGHGINFGVLSGKGLFERFSTGQIETMPVADSWFYWHARKSFSIWKIFDNINRFIVGMNLLTFRIFNPRTTLAPLGLGFASTHLAACLEYAWALLFLGKHQGAALNWGTRRIWPRRRTAREK